MENISFTASDVMALCNLILLLAAVGALVINGIKKANAPNVRQDEKIAEIANKLEAHDKKFEQMELYLKHDKHRLDTLESEQRASNRVIIQTLQVLVRHGIDGNNTDELVKADKALNNYLINERWGGAQEEE